MQTRVNEKSLSERKFPCARVKKMFFAKKEGSQNYWRHHLQAAKIQQKEDLPAPTASSKTSREDFRRRFSPRKKEIFTSPPRVPRLENLL